MTPFEDVTVLSGTDATFECKADLGQPESKVTVFKDSKELYKSSQVKVDVIGSNKVRVVISDVQPKDSGKYKCVLENKSGTDKTEANLSVNCEFALLLILLLLLLLLLLLIILLLLLLLLLLILLLLLFVLIITAINKSIKF